MDLYRGGWICGGSLCLHRSGLTALRVRVCEEVTGVLVASEHRHLEHSHRHCHDQAWGLAVYSWVVLPDWSGDPSHSAARQACTAGQGQANSGTRATRRPNTVRFPGPLTGMIGCRLHLCSCSDHLCPVEFDNVVRRASLCMFQVGVFCGKVLLSLSLDRSVDVLIGPSRNWVCSLHNSLQIGCP